MCGLCTECIKSCPSDNVGVYLQRPLRSVIDVHPRRPDVAWAIVILFGLAIFQMLNALPQYTTVDHWLNAELGFPGYPDPIDYIATIALVVVAFLACVCLLRAALGRRGSDPGAAVDPGRRSAGAWFTPLAYAVVPLVAADYLARQLPHFLAHAPRIIPALSDPLDRGWDLFGTAHSSLYGTQLLSADATVIMQMAVVGVGTLAAIGATWRIVQSDLATFTAHPRALACASSVLVAIAGLGCLLLYHAMAGAQ